jgi:hypothetical protein
LRDDPEIGMEANVETLIDNLMAKGLLRRMINAESDSRWIGLPGEVRNHL